MALRSLRTGELVRSIRIWGSKKQTQVQQQRIDHRKGCARSVLAT